MTRQPLRLYLQILSAFFFIGAIMHTLDLFDLRGSFSTMTSTWQVWTIYLLVMDSVAAVGLYRAQSWGLATFLVVSISQLIAYLGFADVFGPQEFLIGYHVIALAGLAINAFFSLGGDEASPEIHPR